MTSKLINVSKLLNNSKNFKNEIFESNKIRCVINKALSRMPVIYPNEILDILNMAKKYLSDLLVIIELNMVLNMYRYGICISYLKLLINHPNTQIKLPNFENENITEQIRNIVLQILQILQEL